MSSVKRHIAGFDYLRGLACIGVMLYHYTTRYEESMGHVLKWPVSFPMLGRFGVIVFFMISGYLALLHIKQDDTMLSYGYKRATRLYPAYWAAILITSLTMMLLLPERSRTLKEILINLTMLQGFFGVASVDGVYWTLKVELIFYFFIGLLILFKCKKHVLKISFLWMTVLFVMHIIPFENIVSKILNVFLMADNGHIFIAGIAVYNISISKKTANFVESILLIAFCVIYSFLFAGIAEACFFVALTGIIIIITKYNLPDMKILSPLIFVSKISYPLYLVHQFIGFAIIYNVEKYGFTNEIYILIPITVSFLLATLIHKFVEIPLGGFLKKLPEKIKG